MSPGLNPLRPEEVIRALERGGFFVKRQTGSHVILYKPGLQRPITVPMHSRALPIGTQRAIIRQAGLTIEEFLELVQT